jgi:3D (Asp-Asp-Asp) domain-containing protein
MRIISMIIALRFLSFLFLPETAQAAEAYETNETKTNFKIDSNLLFDNNLVQAQDKILALATPNSEGYAQVKTERELQIEKLADKHAHKRESANLPKGKFVINASAYTAAADECGKSDGITASGLKVKVQETIACPPNFPLGTKLRIEGMGTYVCEDRGGAIKGNHIDIYVETKKEAFEFGRQHLVAEIAS